MEHELKSNAIICVMVVRIASRVALFLVVVLSACQNVEELPTLVPTLVPPPPPTATNVAQATATNTPAPPTATPTPTATPVVLTPGPTPLAGIGVNITSPSAESELNLGDEMVVSGLVQLGAGHHLSVTLVSATGHVLAETQPDVSDFNSWQATVAAPDLVSGRAEIRAALVGGDGALVATDSVPIMLRVDPESADQYLILDRPRQADKAVAGYNIFFDGIAQRPVNNVVTISLWDEDCQVAVARQSFRLRGSGYWQGFVVLPLGIGDSLCAVAHFGEPGSDTWREAQVQIGVLSREDERATNVLIGNPPPGRELTPGTTVLLYGTAYNAPEREVLVSILLENGRLLTEGVAAADIYGYWELELFIPADASGPAQIEASIGERGSDDFLQSTVTVHIGEQ